MKRTNVQTLYIDLSSITNWNVSQDELSYSEITVVIVEDLTAKNWDIFQPPFVEFWTKQWDIGRWEGNICIFEGAFDMPDLVSDRVDLGCVGISLTFLGDFRVQKCDIFWSSFITLWAKEQAVGHWECKMCIILTYTYVSWVNGQFPGKVYLM